MQLAPSCVFISACIAFHSFIVSSCNIEGVKNILQFFPYVVCVIVEVSRCVCETDVVQVAQEQLQLLMKRDRTEVFKAAVLFR